MMSRQNWALLAGLFGWLVFGSGLPVAAAGPGESSADGLTTIGNAFVADDEGNAEANSVAEFELTGGHLTLVAVPNLAFESADVAKLIRNPQALTSTAAKVAAGEAGWDGNDERKIEVNDERGINAGWQLTAELGQFNHKAVAGETLTATGINLAGGELTGDNVAGLTLADANFANQAAVLLAAAPDQGTGTTTATFTQATLALPKKEKVRAGGYRASIIWQLAAVPIPRAED